MRIFAFGGTRYAERARVGEWPSDFSQTVEFEDLFALPFGRQLLAYGVGLRDAAPFLIVRERQSEEDRGGYAYTVLLDPGAEIWERFEFNPARLLLAAERQPPFWSELLTSPSTLASPAIIRDRLETLAPRPATGIAVPASLTTRMKIALVGSAIGSVPAAVHGSDLGVDARLDLAQMAALLDDLPVALRIALGWLMGGNPATAAKFGCRLVVDDVSDSSPPAAAAVMSTGAEAAHALEVVERQQLTAAIAPLFEIPMHQWTVDPARLVEHCRVLATLTTGAPEDLAGALVGIAPSDLLHTDIRQAIVRTIAASPVPLPSGVASWALAAYGGAAEVPREVAQRTDAATLAQYLSAAGLTLASKSIKHYRLAPDAAVDVWCAQIAWGDAAHAAELLREATGSLARSGSDPVERQFLVRLTEAAVDRTSAAGVPLRTWLGFSEDARLSPVLAEVLEASARRSAAPSDESWALDYLSCGRDPGATWLAREAGREAIESVVQVAMAFLRDRACGAAAREWLDALADSPARAELPLRLKLQIAESAEGRWLALTQLCQLLRGERFLPGRVPDPAQARLLNMELVTLVSGSVHGIPPEGGVVDLKPILSLVGGTISAELAALFAERFSLDAGGLMWLHAEHPAAFDAIVKREWRTLPAGLLDHVATTTVLELVAEIRALHGPVRQAHDLSLLGRLVPPSTLLSAIEQHPDALSWMASLVGDRALDVEVADALLAVLPEALRPQILARLYAGSPDVFADLVARMVSAGDMPAAGPDVYRFIAGNETMRTRLARSLFGQSSWRGAQFVLESRLCGERSFDEDVPSHEDPPRPSGGASVLGRLFSKPSSPSRTRARTPRGRSR